MENNSVIIDDYFSRFIQTNADIENAKVGLQNTQEILKNYKQKRLEFFKKFNELDPKIKDQIVEYAKERLSGDFFATEEAQQTVKKITTCLACRFNLSCAEKDILFNESCSSM